MMHLEAIIERNKRPVPQPSRGESQYHDMGARVAAALAARNKRPWDTPDPLPEAEAHPR